MEDRGGEGGGDVDEAVLDERLGEKDVALVLDGDVQQGEEVGGVHRINQLHQVPQIE